MEPPVFFLFQLAVILTACRVVGWLVGRMGQPRVVGEMLAGILLGPSLLGWVMPGVHAALFPEASALPISAISRVGVALFMFLVGVDFSPALIRTRLRAAAFVSVAGILVPCALGAVLARALIDNTTLFPAGASGLIGGLFFCTALSVTAFPVLARIIDERGLTQTPLGALTLAAASIDDLAAWSMLALTLALAHGDASGAVTAMGGGALYVAAVFTLVRPLFRRVAAAAERDQRIAGTALSSVLIVVLFGACITSQLGLHEIVGAFVLGLAVPAGFLARELRRVVEPLTLNVLLPLFFVASGLKTQVTLVGTASLWGTAIVIFAAASLGKGLACALAARWSGESRRDAFAIGALMNARGLVELVILNVGLDQGLITRTLFTIMVGMALATTLLASPAVALALRGRSTALPAGSIVSGIDARRAPNGEIHD